MKKGVRKPSRVLNDVKKAESKFINGFANSGMKGKYTRDDKNYLEENVSSKKHLKPGKESFGNQIAIIIGMAPKKRLKKKKV